MDAWTAVELVLLGALAGVLVRLAPVPVAAGAGAALGIGWLLEGWGFWGYSLAAAAAVVSALLATAASPWGTAARP